MYCKVSSFGQPKTKNELLLAQGYTGFSFEASNRRYLRMWSGQSPAVKFNFFSYCLLTSYYCIRSPAVVSPAVLFETENPGYNYNKQKRKHLVCEGFPPGELHSIWPLFLLKWNTQTHMSLGTHCWIVRGFQWVPFYRASTGCPAH